MSFFDNKHPCERFILNFLMWQQDENIEEESLPPDRIFQYKNIQKEALELFRNKNQDYGDAFANYGPVGVLVRMGDKISRLQSINRNGINLVDNESIRDTLIDLHNYAAMAIMLLDENIESDKRNINLR